MWQKQAVGAFIVAFLIAATVYKSKRPQMPFWSIMAFSAFISVIFGLVPWSSIGSVIDLNVILFLVGMFSLVGMADHSGLLSAVACWFVSRFRTRLAVLEALSLLFGLMAAFAVNDTVALMGPPMALIVARAAGVPPQLAFLLLAFSITIGSVATPMGNPQNVLVAMRSGLEAPFVAFLSRLLVPTVLNLAVTPLVLAKLYGVKNARAEVGVVPHEAIKSRRDAAISAAALLAAVAALVANDLMELAGLPHVSERGFIPFVIAAAAYIFSSSPRAILARVDWGTIVFFMTMFITMRGVWDSGVLQPLLDMISPDGPGTLRSLAAIWVASLLLSQVLSNVPFVNVYIDYLKSLGYAGKDVRDWLALAAASTIAGNLTPLGAASNIIILEFLESHGNATVSFKEFAKAGALITAINTAIYFPFLLL